jgi:hypothetical protein
MNSQLATSTTSSTTTNSRPAGDAASESTLPEVISSYSRAQAIEDGVLVDLSTIAPEVCRQHYKHPVACTTGVWAIIERAIANEKWMNDLNGVVHDILWMSRACARAIDASSRLFTVIITGAGRQRTYTFKIVCGPGDNAEPVITVMLPNED